MSGPEPSLIRRVLIGTGSGSKAAFLRVLRAWGDAGGKMVGVVREAVYGAGKWGYARGGPRQAKSHRKENSEHPQVLAVSL